MSGLHSNCVPKAMYWSVINKMKYGDSDEESIYIVCNMSNKCLDISPLNELGLSGISLDKRLLDNITGFYFNIDTFKLNPYQVMWVSVTD